MKKIFKKLLMIGVITPVFTASATCSVSLDAIYFGNYNPFKDTDVLSSSKASVTCSAPTSYTLKMRTGTSGNVYYRYMTNTIYPEKNTPLRYGLFLDSARSIVWGDGTGITQVFQGSTNEGVPDNIVIYGKIYKLQNVYKGSYAESVIMELDY